MGTTREHRRRPAAAGTPTHTPPGGSTLPASTQSHMGAAFGHDFSQVRVFADEAAAESAEQIGAQAYTVGSDIFFNHNSFRPQDGDGKALLAHELTHVVQQERHGGAMGALSGVSDPGDTSEREASALAGRAAAGERVQVRAAPTAVASRGLLDWAESEASAATHAVGGAVSSAGHAVGGAVSSAGHALGGAAGAAWNGAKGVATEVGHTVGHVASEAGDLTRSAAHTLGHEASEAEHRVVHAASDAGHWVGHEASEVGHTVRHVASEAGDLTLSAAHRLGHEASEVGHTVGHAASEAGHAVRHVASEAGHAVGAAGEWAYGGMKAGSRLVQKGEQAVGHGIDWAEEKEKEGTSWAAGKAKGIPVLEQAANAGKAYLDTETELVGGVGRGATGLVGGVAGMVVNPVDTAKGLEAMGEHIPGVGDGLKAAHGLVNVALGSETMTQLGQSLSPEQSLKDDGQFWKTVGGGLVGQYSEQWKQGKYADVVGHAGFDIASLVMGAGEANAAGKLGEASRLADAGKLGDAAQLGDAAKLGESAKIGDAAQLGDAADAGGLEARGLHPAPGERAMTREQYQAGQHAERQADFEQFRTTQTDKLAGQNLSPEELQSAIGQARRRTQIRDADVQRFHGYTEAPTGRAAEIDQRTGANYQRLLQEQMGQEPFQYRYTNKRMAGIYEDAGKIDRPTFMTDSRFESNAQSMDKAQVAEDWGVHQVGMKIPTSEIVDAKVPRPFGNSPHIKSGWEPHTNSYPEYGSGGALQYLGKTERYDPAWAYDLSDDFARKGGTAPAAAGLSPSAEGARGLSSQADEAARLRQSGGGGHDPVPPTQAAAPQSPQQHLIEESERQYQDLVRRSGLDRSDPEYLSRNQAGPVQSTVLDTKDASGQVHPGLNNGGRDNLAEKLPPDDLHPLLQERLEAQEQKRQGMLEGLKQKEAAGVPLTREEKGVLTAGTPGYHSEVYALDAALKAREMRTGIPVMPDDLGDFMLHNITLKGKQAGGVPYRCFNCDPITEGVSLTSPLEDSERLAHEPHTH